mmetsp:Transcript_15012/g.31077  ORF Transcript_15012/g.31077 Transcript_15012/m.31077 type:complete len:289 (+) Transcript_15012:1215-2081(+)
MNKIESNRTNQFRSIHVVRRVHRMSPKPHTTSVRSLHGSNRRKDHPVASSLVLLLLHWWKSKHSSSLSCFERPPPPLRAIAIVSRCLAHMRGGKTKARNVWETPPTSPLSRPKAGTKVAAPAAIPPRIRHTIMCVFHSTSTKPPLVLILLLLSLSLLLLLVQLSLPIVTEAVPYLVNSLPSLSIVHGPFLLDSKSFRLCCRFRKNRDNCCSKTPIEGRITTGYVSRRSTHSKHWTMVIPIPPCTFKRTISLVSAPNKRYPTIPKKPPMPPHIAKVRITTFWNLFLWWP